MALTGAERQRRHRQKMKAEGRVPKPRKKPAKTNTEKMMEKRQKSTERQRKRRQRIQAENGFFGHPPSDSTTAEDAFVIFKREQDVVLDYQIGLGGFVVKQDPELRLESSGLVVKETRDAAGDLNLGCHRGDEISHRGHQSSSKQFEEVVSHETLVGQTLAEECDEARDFGGVSIREGISYNEQSTGSHASLDAPIAQQRLERRRWCAAERQRKRRSRLRAEGKYQVYKQKHNVISGRHRSKQKEQEKALPERVRKEVVAKRRKDTRVRVARHRERKKGMQHPVMINSSELVQQPELRKQYSSVNHSVHAVGQTTPVLEMQVEDGISPPNNFVSFLPGLVPNALPTLECQTVTTTGASVSTGSTLYMPNSSQESKDWSGNVTGEDEIQSADAPSVDYHSSHHYVTPPIWPCASNNRIEEEPSSPVPSTWSNHDGGRLGTSQANQEQILPRPIYSKENQVETQSNQARTSEFNPDPCGLDSVRIELVTEFDQDCPYTINHLPYGPNGDNMPEDLRNKLQAMEHQSPLLYNYMMKLQSDIACLRAENQQLRKRTLCLNEIKTNKTVFQFWTGFPDYSYFKAVFELLKSNVGPVTCPHPTDAPTLEEEFFYVLVRLRVGLFVKDIATRIGISEADYVLMFHRWITALCHNLPNIFQVHDEADGGKQNQTVPRVTSSTDCAKVLVDCNDMLSTEAVRKWRNTRIPVPDRCKFVMAVSFATGSVRHVSDVSPNESDSYSVLVRLSHLHSTIIGMPGSRGNPTVGSGGLVQAQSDCLIKVVNHIRSFHILDNYQMKLQCETFRAVFKVCALLSNVMK